MKRIYLTIFLCCILLSSCNNLKTGNKNVPITQIEWDNITERVTLEAIKLPTLCNIENMAASDWKKYTDDDNLYMLPLNLLQIL